MGPLDTPKALKSLNIRIESRTMVPTNVVIFEWQLGLLYWRFKLKFRSIPMTNIFILSCPFATQRGDGAHCSSQSNGSNFEQQNLTRPKKIFGLDSKLFSKVQIDSKWYWAKKGVARHQSVTESHNFTFGVGAISAESPFRIATFIVNSKPHTGKRLARSAP